MGNVVRIEDLSPDQLRAQVRLCFKFMEQCISLLNGEEINDDAAIRLVDPIGSSSDMELFYTCKRIGAAGELADAIETIDMLRKQNDKLRERLKKKHFEVEKLEERLDTSDKQNADDVINEVTRRCNKIIKDFRDFYGLKIDFMPTTVLKPKFAIGQKVYFIISGVASQSEVVKIRYDRLSGYSYIVKGIAEFMPENRLFDTVEELLLNLKENIQNGK